MSKLVLALVLAAMMIVSMIPAFGAGSLTKDGSIKVTGLAEGDTARFYKLIEWTGAEGDTSGWKATEKFASVLTPAALSAAIEGENPTGITATLANQLAKVSDKGDPAKTVNVLSDGEAVFDAPEEGIYMVIVTPPVDADVVYSPIFVSCDFEDGNGSELWDVTEDSSYYGTGGAKKSTVELTKTAKSAEEIWDDYTGATTTQADGNGDDGKSTTIGDTINYQVETTIPGYGDVFTTPTFVLTDTLTALKLKTLPVVKVNNETLTDGTEYDLTGAVNDTTYTITFKADYLKTLVEPAELVVTYDALVTIDAVANVNIEKNDVEIKFSHTPTDENDFNVKKDTTQHYTFTIDANILGGNGSIIGESGSEIIKVAVDKDGKPIYDKKQYSTISEENYVESPLADAHFKLYTDAACTTEYVPKDADGNTLTPLDIVSGADGRMEIKGLDAGIYYPQITLPSRTF